MDKDENQNPELELKVPAPRKVFILIGSAGIGKSSLTKMLVEES